MFLENENIFKCLVVFQKMFWKIFSCIFENALKNTFSTHFSYFHSFQTNIIIKISIYKPKEKKIQNENLNSTNPTLDRERERDLI